MKIEIEAKIRITDVREIERRLVALGARRQPLMLELNIFLDTPDRRLRTTDCGLRIREIRYEDGTINRIMTFKGPRSPGVLKSRREVEMTVGDTETALALLGELGYREVIRFEKRRRRYPYDGCNIELDEMPYLGNFVEIEGPDDETVLQVRDKLGLADQSLIRTSYVSMLMTHLDQRRILDRNVTFENAQPTHRANPPTA